VTHKVWIRSDLLKGCPGRSVVEVGDEGELVQVVKLDYELGPGQTLQQVAEGYAGLRNLRLVTS
jgi:hypothetical protein